MVHINNHGAGAPSKVFDHSPKVCRCSRLVVAGRLCLNFLEHDKRDVIEYVPRAQAEDVAAVVFGI